MLRRLVGKIPIDVNKMNVDLMSISGIRYMDRRVLVRAMFDVDQGSDLIPSSAAVARSEDCGVALWLHT